MTAKQEPTMREIMDKLAVAAGANSWRELDGYQEYGLTFEDISKIETILIEAKNRTKDT